MMNEVYPGIYVIEERGAMGVLKPPENVYVIAGPDGLIFDGGYGQKKAVKYIVQEIKKIESSYKSQGKEFYLSRVFPSHAHPDHVSGVKYLKKYLGVKIILADRTAKIINNKKSFYKFFDFDYDGMLTIRKRRHKIGDKLKLYLYRLFYYALYGVSFIKNPDKIIEEESEIVINGEKWQTFHSPGHSSDHISLYNEKNGILFSGDNILRKITTWLGPPDSNLNDYIKSIQYIQKLTNLKLILPAHGSPVTNPKERIEEILQHRERRTQQVIEILKKNLESGVSASTIVYTLYPGQKRFMRNTARGWICETLKMLEEKGDIRRVVENKRLRFKYIAAI